MGLKYRATVAFFFKGITTAAVDFNKYKKIASRKQLECKENDLKNQSPPKAV
jgi:hypothetical protein